MGRHRDRLVLRTTRNALAVLACVIIVGSMSESACAQSKWDLPALQQAVEAANSRNCRLQWYILWPLAKQGNAEARYLLWAGMTDSLRPPGPTSQAIRKRQLLTFSIYATMAARGPSPPMGDPNHKWARTDIPIVINELSLGAKGTRVAACYKARSAYSTCLKLALTLGIVPTFEDFAEELDARAQQEQEAASCLPRPW
jgi:hypothetical protein